MTRSDRSKFIVKFCCIRPSTEGMHKEYSVFQGDNLLRTNDSTYVGLGACVLVLSGEKEAECSVVETYLTMCGPSIENSPKRFFS